MLPYISLLPHISMEVHSLGDLIILIIGSIIGLSLAFIKIFFWPIVFLFCLQFVVSPGRLVALIAGIAVSTLTDNK